MVGFGHHEVAFLATTSVSDRQVDWMRFCYVRDS
jgi:hypothetical protein